MTKVEWSGLTKTLYPNSKCLLLQRAAEQGNAMAMTNLGFLLMVMGTDDVPQNYVEARQYFTEAAIQGNAIAEYNLGAIFENGLGVEKDLNQALKWYSKSAAQGDELAQVALRRLSTSLIST